MKATPAVIQPLTPAVSARAQIVIDRVKPAMPTRIIGLARRSSSRLAQKGATTAQSRADSEKAIAISASGSPIVRPIAGSTDCSPVLPIATHNMTQNSNIWSCCASFRMNATLGFLSPSRESVSRPCRRLTVTREEVASERGFEWTEMVHRVHSAGQR